MKKKLSLVCLVAIILLAVYLRLYMIADYMTFLGDEGRDVLVAKGILSGHFTLLGPRASAGDFFLGPIYYYMITPWLWLFQYDPVGPAVMVGLLSVVTVWLIYFVGKQWFDERTGLIAAALYTVSPVVIAYSRSSWNPNVLPFFSLLLIFVLFKGVTLSKGWKYFVLTGFLLGIALQLHYLALFLGVIVALYLFFGSWLHNKHIVFKILIIRYLQVFIGFLIGFSPFLLFEVRHNFANIRTIFSFIFSDTSSKTVYQTGSTFFATISDVFFRVFAKLVFFFPDKYKYDQFDPILLQSFMWFIVAMAIASLISVWFIKNKQVRLLIYLWFFVGVFLFGFYKKSIYDYYFTFLFPLPFLLIANLLVRIAHVKIRKNIIWGGVLSSVIFVGIFYYNWEGRPFRYAPNRQKEQVKKISQEVIKLTDNKPYNFALISGGNSDHAYRYFLEVLGHKPVMLENQINDPKRTSVTGQLIVVCEDISCKPLGNSLFEVAGFGRAEIVKELDVSVVKVFKLVPYKKAQ
jgi:4-amino-4-deoxy-L-arabinose transferase-like glycosyltransferase